MASSYVQQNLLHTGELLPMTAQHCSCHVKTCGLQHKHAWPLISMSSSALLSGLNSASLQPTAQSDLAYILAGVFSVDSDPNSISDMQLLYTEPSAAVGTDAQGISVATPPNEPAADQITGHPQLSTPPNTLAAGEQCASQGQHHHHSATQARQAIAAEQVFLYLQVQLLLCQNAHLLKQWSQWQVKGQL